MVQGQRRPKPWWLWVPACAGTTAAGFVPRAFEHAGSPLSRGRTACANGMTAMDLQANQFQRMSVEEFDTTKLLAHASKQARERGYERFPIVDVDSHHYENESMAEILDYLDDPVLKQLALAGARPNAKNARILNTLVG